MKRLDVKGQRFGRLVALRWEHATRSSSYWMCRCDCGNFKVAALTNLKAGSIKSCGCLQKETGRINGAMQKKPPRVCVYDGCENTCEKGGKGFCGKHYARYRRHGDASYTTPEEVRVQRQRYSFMSNDKNRPSSNTYKKHYGRHEHRVIAEKKIGRKLAPGEHVHHVDGDKHNNNPENLEVMTASEHCKLHAKERKNK